MRTKWQLGALALGLLLLAACRTEGTPVNGGEVPATDATSRPAAVGQAGTAAPGNGGEAAPASLTDPVPLPAVISGYDFRGLATCLPLPNERRCISRNDPLATACGVAGGESQRCEDCSTICSRALSPK